MSAFDQSPWQRLLSPRRTLDGEPLFSLKGVNTATLPDGCLSWVQDAGVRSLYVFLRESADAELLPSLVEPNAGPGRWQLLVELLPPGECCVPLSITVDDDYTAVSPFRVIFVAGTLPPIAPGPARTITLPLVPVLNEEYTVKDVTGTASAATPIVVDGNGFMIDGTATKMIAAAFGAMRLKFDGTQWRIL